MQVLCVEDNFLEAEVVEAMLRSEGHFCHTTGSGRQAVVLAKRNDYDLIILDINLPDIDGFEVIQQMRAKGLDIPFLIQSGLVDRDHKLDGLGFGVEDYLIKPFSKDELVSCMESVMSRLTQTTATTVVPFPTLHSKFLAEGTDRREHRRFATLMSAEIDDGENRRACTILNLSEGGATIRLVGEPTRCPPIFKLSMPYEIAQHCRVCWRLGDKLGVRFAEAKTSYTKSERS